MFLLTIGLVYLALVARRVGADACVSSVFVGERGYQASGSERIGLELE